MVEDYGKAVERAKSASASMGSRFMQGTAISLTSFFRTAAINERMNMVVRSKNRLRLLFATGISKQWMRIEPRPRGRNVNSKQHLQCNIPIKPRSIACSCR